LYVDERIRQQQAVTQAISELFDIKNQLAGMIVVTKSLELATETALMRSGERESLLKLTVESTMMIFDQIMTTSTGRIMQCSART